MTKCEDNKIVVPYFVIKIHVLKTAFDAFTWFLCEVVIHGTRALFTLELSLGVLRVDIRNAFGSVDRSTFVEELWMARVDFFTFTYICTSSSAQQKHKRNHSQCPYIVIRISLRLRHGISCLWRIHLLSLKVRLLYITECTSSVAMRLVWRGQLPKLDPEYYCPEDLPMRTKKAIEPTSLLMTTGCDIVRPRSQPQSLCV